MKKLLDQLAALHATYWKSPRFDSDLAWVLLHISGPIHELFSHQAGVPMLINWEVQSRQFKRIVSRQLVDFGSWRWSTHRDQRVMLNARRFGVVWQVLQQRV